MEEGRESDGSLSLSLTPPILEDDKKNEESDESISEHITPHTDSIENDRSYQEIEITNKPNSVLLNFKSLELNGSDQSKEAQGVLDSSNNSIISLNFLERISNTDHVDEEVKHILEDLLGNVPYTPSDNINSLSNSNEVSLNIFANVDLDDKSLTNRHLNVGQNVRNLISYHFGNAQLNNGLDLGAIIKDTEELIPLKETTIAALTDLDSFRELSNTTSSLSKTEYKQLQEDCHNKILEYNTAIIYKNELIQQLSESLDQSVAERKDLLNQISHFKEEIAILQKNLEETTKMMSGHKIEIHPTDKEDLEFNLEKALLDIEHGLNDDKKNLLKELKLHLNIIIKENITKNNNLEQIEQLKAEKEEFEAEIVRLRGLLANIKCGSTEIMEIKDELENQHSKEMEELRTYFEKKCADLEKNYSEEIFSQQSRKMSGSTSSEAELNSDMLFSHPPGPAGDVSYDLQPNITKKDILNLQNELKTLLDKINNFNSIENITETDLNRLKDDITQVNLANLLKFDLSTIRNDLQNKYHAELEILREDNENKIDILRVEHANRVKDLEERYMQEINDLKMQLEDFESREVQQPEVSSAVQEVTSSGEFEINEVIQSYERRLQEQVALAQVDIITALELNIQRLASGNGIDDWPPDLLRLRDKFAEKYEKEIEQLKDEHANEVARLKDEHLKILNGALERARRRSLRDGDSSLTKGELEILRERDNLKIQVTSLRHVLSELVKYFTECEDELNNTLVDELLRQGFDKNMTQIDDELNITNTSPTNSSSKTSDYSTNNITRVHLTPNFTDLINIIENSCSQAGDSSSVENISIDLKNELGTCLEKLKQEANVILSLTSNIKQQQADDTPEEKIESLKKQLINEARLKEQHREQLDDAMRYVEVLEKHKDELEMRIEDAVAKGVNLEKDLIDAKNKIALLIEHGRKEIVSEGYGEDGANVRATEDSMLALVEMQEKARSMLAQSRASADPTLLHLIEELCRISEKIKDESRRDKEDLLQQIDVADKKYKTTQKFLEDQAVEREMERDEAQKKINLLYDQLREREKDRTNCERVTAEVNRVCHKNCTGVQVDHLEQQLQEMTRALDGETQRHKDTETERNEAVEKIKVLRDIIRELEHQLEDKVTKIREYEQIVEKLQHYLEEHQAVPNNSSLKSDEATKNNIRDINELYRHMEHLENEVQRLRAYSELVGSEGALKEIQKQLSDIDAHLEKKTKELETLHSTENTNCSSPSEDISVRDIVRSSVNTMEECEVPLQQLARLKEKLMRHSRAEDTAIKRIRDLEMQVYSLKNELEEVNNEKDYMKKQIQEHLVLISDFQIRLDEQRIRAEHIENETNTSLEHKIYDMQNEILSLREKLSSKDKMLTQKHNLLVETQDKVKRLEEELTTTKDDDIIVEMQRELEVLRKENKKMKNKIAKDKEIVPNLVENIISDKNTDIEKLRDRLHETEKQLELYTTLNMDMKELQMLSNIRNTLTFEQMISSFELSRPDVARRADFHEFSDAGLMMSHPNLLQKQQGGKDHTMEPEISSIVGSPQQHKMHLAQISYKNSTELPSQKKVHFDHIVELETLRNEVSNLKAQLDDKEKLTAQYQERLMLLDNLEAKIEKLQVALDETEKALAQATETFEREQKALQEREKNLGIELAEKKIKLEETEKQIALLWEDSKRKDEMCLSLTREKRHLEDAVNAARNENFASILSGKDEEIGRLKKSISNLNRQISILSDEQAKLHKMLEFSQDKNKSLEASLSHSNNEVEKLTKELNNNQVMTDDVAKEIVTLKEKVKKKHKALKEQQFAAEKSSREVATLDTENKRLKKFLKEREDEVQKAVNEAKQCEKELLMCEKELLELRAENKQLIERDESLRKIVDEKNKVIMQMERDYQQVHVNLLKVESKLKESGNVCDLMKKLKEKQQQSEQFRDEINDLKAQLMRYKNEMAQSVDEITDKVQKELDYSAQIDTNIMSAVSDQSLSSIADNEDVEIYKHALAKEREAKKDYLIKMNSLQNKNAQLWDYVEKQKAQAQETRMEDAKLIESMRNQLHAAFAKQEQLNRELSDRQDTCKRLQDELELLKKKQAISSTSQTESTEYKSLPNSTAMELKRLREEYGTFQEERQNLKQQIDDLKQSQIEHDNELKHTKDMLTMELLRCKNLHEKIQEYMELERRMREVIMQKDLEIERINNEKDNEKSSMNKQKNDMVLKQLQELNAALLDNRKLMVHIQKIGDEKRALEVEIETLRNCTGNNVRFADLIARIDYLFAKTLRHESTIKALIWQKRYLSNYISSHERFRVLSSIRDGVNTNDPMPYTNVDGIRIAGNDFEVILKESPIMKFRRAAIVVIAILRMKYLVRRWHSGVRRVEQINMRHYGDHVGHTLTATTTSRAYNNAISNNAALAAMNAHFQVGQPVSSQVFLSRATTTTSVVAPPPTDSAINNSAGAVEDGDAVHATAGGSGLMGLEAAWSGQSPPSKETRATSSSALRRDDINPMAVPHLLDRFTERMDQIQKRLGVVLFENLND